ncbi:MAG: molybdopterin-guanine dinucleotide biosynthesis protein B [Candidatus Thorarchaeota archaeon]
MMETPHILQVVGLSKSGKTSFVSELIKKLSNRKELVTSIKSAKTHNYIISDKDSDTFLKSGSSLSVVSFRNTTQFTSKEEIDLSRIIEISLTISKSSVIIIEGYKKLNYSKVLIWNSETLSNISEFNLEGIKYVYCPQENFIENEENIKRLRKKIDFHLETNIDNLISKIIEDMFN